MKKFICAILTSAFLLTSVIPAFAADSIKVSESGLADILAEFGNNMPEDPNQRILIWKTFKAYMADGNNGINTIIDALEGTKPVPSDLQDIFDKFVNNVKGKYGDQFIFMLKLYSTTDIDARIKALDNFGSNPTMQWNGVYTEIEKTPLPVSAEAKAAADAIWKSYISAETETGFDYHDIDAANFLNLITPFKGKFKMTEDKNGNLVLARGYSASFAKDLATSMKGYSSVNGVEIKSSWSSEVKGYKILTAIVDMFNSFDNATLENGVGKKDNLKVVLDDPEIDLFEKGLREADDITPSDKPDPGKDDNDNTGGNSGSGRPNRRPGTTTPDTFELGTPSYDKAKSLFNDMEASSWAVPYVMNLTERKIFKGYEDGSFRPDISISRQEIAVALVRAMGLEPDAEVASNGPSGFSDDADIALWARGYVNIAVSKNLFTGYDDGEFKPTRTISRQELATVIMRLANDTTTEVKLPYGDASEIQAYAQAHVGRATTLKILGGYPDNTFRPFNDVTRAEAAKMLYGGLEYFDYVGSNR